MVKGTGRRGLITVRTHEEHEQVVVTISETVDRPGPARTPGDGGATLARAIVDRHGGQMTVETTPGAGITYVLRLPIDGPGPAGSAP